MDYLAQCQACTLKHSQQVATPPPPSPLPECLKGWRWHILHVRTEFYPNHHQSSRKRSSPTVQVMSFKSFDPTISFFLLTNMHFALEHLLSKWESIGKMTN